MKLYYPSYYKDFSCIAGECPDSCRRKWEIVIDGDTLKGTYADGSKWASSYKFVKSGKTLTLEDGVNVKCVYESCTIPEEIITEATTTRSSDVVPFL